MYLCIGRPTVRPPSVPLLAPPLFPPSPPPHPSFRPPNFCPSVRFIRPCLSLRPSIHPSVPTSVPLSIHPIQILSKDMGLVDLFRILQNLAQSIPLPVHNLKVSTLPQYLGVFCVKPLYANELECQKVLSPFNCEIDFLTDFGFGPRETAKTRLGKPRRIPMTESVKQTEAKRRHLLAWRGNKAKTDTKT